MEPTKTEPKNEKRDPIKEISIEVCQNCNTHKWCTRHDETKYNALFEETKKAIEAAIGKEIQILKNPNIKKPKIGAFEVLCNKTLIFSKIKCGLFPVPPALAQRVQLFVTDYNAGNDVEKYCLIEEKKYSPPKKKITQTSLDWNAKYEELKKSQSKPKNSSESPEKESEKEKPLQESQQITNENNNNTNLNNSQNVNEEITEKEKPVENKKEPIQEQKPVHQEPVKEEKEKEKEIEKEKETPAEIIKEGINNEEGK